MTIQIDAARIRLERINRAWTQQHLAEVAGLGLRTIQRIESTGSASPESTQAIASCLELRVPDLIVEERQPRGSRIRVPAALAAILVASAFSAMLLRPASATDVTLDFAAIVTVQDDRYKHSGQTSVADGDTTEFEMGGVFRILVTPVVLDAAGILVSMKVFSSIDGEQELVSEPRLLTKDGQEVVFSMGMKDAQASMIRVAVTPSL